MPSLVAVTHVLNGIGHMCSILYISSALEPPAKLYVTTEVPIPTPTANPTSASSTVTIGSSNTNPKTGVSCGDYCICPFEVTTGGDTFEIVVSGSTLTATRTDADSNWGMNLKITCRAGYS